MAWRLSNVKARTRFKQRLFLGLGLKPLRLFCEHCDKYVPSDMEWTCSHCNHANVHTTIYSYLNKCRECKRSPKSYFCPHCVKVNFLDEDEDASHPAYQTSAPDSPTASEELALRRRKEHEWRKEEIEREIVITQLNAKLVSFKASTEFKKEISVREKLEKSFSEHDAHLMGAHTIAREQNEKNAKVFKDDAELLEMANDSVAKWLESQI